jgi:hypothetical protein
VIVAMKNLKDQLDFGAGTRSHSQDSRIVCTREQKTLDWLIFVDSRGLGRPENSDPQTSFLFHLMAQFERDKQSVMMVSRPLYLTIFPSLVYFLKQNRDYQFNNLITNLGFVDTTPKKKAVLEDVAKQLTSLDLKSNLERLEKYQLSDGKTEILSTSPYSSEAIQTFSQTLKSFRRAFFINTPTIDPNRVFERKRPACFYSQIEVGNQLTAKICDGAEGQLVDISNQGIKTFDGVHYTEEDHKQMTEQVNRGLRLHPPNANLPS